MDSLPPEVIRIIFEHLNYNKRMAIGRVNRLWAYLALIFSKIFEKYSIVDSKHVKINESQIKCLRSIYYDDNECLVIGCENYIHIIDQEGNDITRIGLKASRLEDISINHLVRKIVVLDNSLINHSIHHRIHHRIHHSIHHSIHHHHHHHSIPHLHRNCNSLIKIFDYNGKKISGFKLNEPQNPTLIAIEYKTNNIIVVDSVYHDWDDVIYIFDWNGNFLSSFRMNNICIDPGIAINQINRNIIVTKGEFNTIIGYDCNGNNIFVHCLKDDIEDIKIFIAPGNDLIVIHNKNDINIFDNQIKFIYSIDFFKDKCSSPINVLFFHTILLFVPLMMDYTFLNQYIINMILEKLINNLQLHLRLCILAIILVSIHNRIYGFLQV